MCTAEARPPAMPALCGLDLEDDVVNKQSGLHVRSAMEMISDKDQGQRMSDEIRITVTVSDQDVAGARYIRVSVRDEPPRDVGTLTPLPGSDLGPPFRFWGHPIGEPHLAWVTELESEGRPYGSVEGFVTALMDALLPP